MGLAAAAPKTNTPNTVDAALKGLAQSEATWEPLRPNHIPRGEYCLTIHPVSVRRRCIRLSTAVIRAAFGEGKSLRVRLEVNRKARKLAVVLDPRGDYAMREGEFGGATLSRLVMDAGFTPGRYKTECTKGRVEISAGGRF